MPADPGVCYRFGAFRFEVGERRLLRDGRPVPLTPKVFDTLVLLLENAGRLVTKERLLQEIWPGLVVEEANLTKNIWSLRKALGEAPGEGGYIETVPKVGYRWIGPAERVDAASPACDAAPPPPPDPTPAPSEEGAPLPAAPAPQALTSAERSGTRRWLGVATAAAVALAAWVASRHAVPGARPPSPARARRSLAVLGFRDLAPRDGTAWVSTAATEMIGAELGAGESIRIVAADDVARERVALPAGTLSAETLAQLRRHLGSDLVVTGSYLAVAAPPDGRLRFDVVVQDAATGEVLATASQTGSAADVLDLIASLGASLRTRLGLPPASSAQSDSIAAALPRNPEAARLYAEGLDRLRRLDAKTAKDDLQSAAEKDPTNPLVRLALSRAWSALGYDDNARAEARRASEASGGLSREDRLVVESRLAEAEKSWDHAVEIDRSLVLLFPDDLDYGLKLAADQTAAGRAKEALETIARLRRMPSPERDDPRLDLAEASAAAALSDSARALAAAHRAGEKAAADGRTGLLARARIQEAGASGSLGMTDRSRDARREAARLYEADGDVNGLALTRIGIGNDRFDAGDLDGAAGLYAQALASYESIGNKAGVGTAYADLCLVEWLQGKTDSARAHAERVIALRRETNDRAGTAWALDVLGNFLVQEGDFAGASRLHGEALSISHDIGHRAYEAYSLDAIADAFRAQGRLDEAEKAYRESLDVAEKLDDPDAIGGRHEDLGNIEFDRGNLEEADRRYAKALALLAQSGDTIGQAEIRIQIAQLRRVQGRNAEAIALAAQSVKEFENQHQAANLAIALSTRARAELELGRRDAAREDVRKARVLAAESNQNEAVLEVLLTAARVEAAAGNVEGARALAAEARRRAERLKWVGHGLEARLVEAEIDLEGPRHADALAALSAVAREARTSGYGQTAREAESAARGKPAA